MKHFILDMETLSDNALNGIAVDCAVLVFDDERFTSDDPYTFKELEKKAQKFRVSVKEQKEKYGYKISQGTLDWWKGQSKEAQKCLIPQKDDLSVSDFCVKVLKYIEKYGPVKYWWSRSKVFDPIFLQRMMIDSNHFEEMGSHLKFWSVRDTRTWIDAKLDFPDENGFCPISDKEYWEEVFVGHDSIHDVVADTLRMQTIARLENDMEMPSK